MIVMGIDPDRGYALVRFNKIISAGTVKGIEALEKVISEVGSYARDSGVDLLVRIERPKDPTVYPRPGLSLAAMKKVARNVGMNYQKAEELGRYCAGLRLKYEFVEPVKGRRGLKGKLTAKQVMVMTGYQGKTSSHSRDAIMIALR